VNVRIIADHVTPINLVLPDLFRTFDPETRVRETPSVFTTHFIPPNFFSSRG
jgi:hypothetical protein